MRHLPEDAARAVLAGRVWRPELGGPSVIAVRGGEAFDISAAAATMRDLCEADDPVGIVRGAAGESLSSVEALIANAAPDGRDGSKPWLLAPLDLQAIKAAGVTFAVSMLERVIEERARGDLTAAAAIRARIGITPAVGVVLGSGLGAFATELTDAVTIPYGEIPHWPASTAIGHAANTSRRSEGVRSG